MNEKCLQRQKQLVKNIVYATDIKMLQFDWPRAWPHPFLDQIQTKYISSFVYSCGIAYLKML